MNTKNKELEQPEAADENEKYNLPCPYNPKVKCVQYPEDECGCDPCGECETKLKASEKLARKFHETYERLAPDFGYKTRKASTKPWKDVPSDNKQLMIAVCKEILQPYSTFEMCLDVGQEYEKQIEELEAQVKHTVDYCKVQIAMSAISIPAVVAITGLPRKEVESWPEIDTEDCKNYYEALAKVKRIVKEQNG